jgi:hypothetical protein
MEASKQLLDQAWCDGYELAAMHAPIERNPFPSGTAEHDAWIAGWHGYFQYQEQRKAA